MSTRPSRSRLTLGLGVGGPPLSPDGPEGTCGLRTVVGESAMWCGPRGHASVRRRRARRRIRLGSVCAGRLGGRPPHPAGDGGQSSIAPMTESPGEAARFLARNSVDCLPEGALERQLARGAAPAREARDRPHRARHPPRPHRGPAQAARVPGPRPHRRPDRGRLHRARGRPERPLGHPAGALQRADRRERRHLPAPGLHRPGPRSHRGAPQRRVAGHGDGGPVPPRPHRHRGPAARARRLRQALRRPASRSRSSSCSIPLLQGYDSVAVRADVELGGTDQKFNLLLARDIQQAYGVPPQSVLTTPILPGTDGVQRMAKSLGNYVGVTEPPEEIFGKLMRVPDTVMPRLLRPAAGLRARRVRCPRCSASATWRVRSRPDSMARRRLAAPRRTSTACTWRARRPRRSRSSTLPAGDATVHLPALLRDAFGVSASEARRLLAQGGVKLDGEAMAGEELDVPAERLDGGVLQVGKRRFRRSVCDRASCQRYTARSPHERVLGLFRGALLMRGVRTSGIPARKARRSLKTQQHVRPRVLRDLLVASRFDLPHAACRGAEGLTEPSNPSNPGPARCTSAGPSVRRRQLSMRQ